MTARLDDAGGDVRESCAAHFLDSTLFLKGATEAERQAAQRLVVAEGDAFVVSVICVGGAGADGVARSGGGATLSSWIADGAALGAGEDADFSVGDGGIGDGVAYDSAGECEEVGEDEGRGGAYCTGGADGEEGIFAVSAGEYEDIALAECGCGVCFAALGE